MSDREIFADNLAYFMANASISRNDLCNALNLKYTTVRDWLKGISYPRIDKVRLLASYFGVSMSDLIERRNNDAQ